MNGTVQTVAQYYLKTPDGTVYGPVDIATLCTWATDARVIPGCVLSVDRTNWVSVDQHPELRLNWSVQFDDGTAYGPLNLLAIWILALEESIPKGVALVERETHRRVVLNDSLYPLLVAECRQVLTGCGRLMADAIGNLAGDRKSAVSALADREARLEELKAKLEQSELEITGAKSALEREKARSAALTAGPDPAEVAALQADLETARLTLADRESQLGSLKFKLAQTESDLAVNLKLVSETQRHLSESENSGARFEAHAREVETLRANLVTARMTLTERESQLDAVRMKLGETENELAVSQKLVSETQRRLAEYAALAALAGAGNQENEVLCRSLATARVDLAERDSQIEVFRARQAHADADLKTERGLSAGLKERLATTESERDREAARAGAAELKAVGLAADLAGREEALAALQARLASLEAERVDSRAKLEGALTAQQDAEARVEAGLQARTGAEAEAAALRGQRATLEAELESARAGSEALRRTEQELRATQAELESGVAALRQSLATAGAKSLADAETLQGVRQELDALTLRLSTSMSDVQERENRILRLESSLAVAKAEAEKQVSQLQSRLDLSQQALQTEQDHVRKEAEANAHLRSEQETLTARLHELQTDVLNKETIVRKHEAALAVQRAENDRQVSAMRSKHSVLEKDLQLARQNAHTLSMQLGQAKESAVKAQKAGRAAEQKLKEEMASVQADLNGLMLASKCVKQVRDKSKPAPIDWMGGEGPVPDSGQPDGDVQARFEKLPLTEKIVVLQKELQASAEQKELMRREIETLKGRYELLSNEGARKDRESDEKLAQIRKELKTSAEQLHQAMQEIERRESVIRDLRKKSAGASPEAEKPAVLEAEVIHAETLGPDESAPHDAGAPHPQMRPEPAPAPSEPVPPESPHHGRILNSVEAQLQRELKKWESLKREKDNKDGTLSKWFRRK